MSTLKSYSPVTTKEVGQVEVTDQTEYDRILSKCRKAQAVWANTSNKDKRKMLVKLREVLTSEIEEIAKIVCSETGKPRAEGYNTEVLASAAMVAHCEGFLKEFKFKKKVNQGSMAMFMTFLGRKSVIEYKPFGIIGIISSYNFPFVIPSTQAVTAVTTGNGVIVKSSSDTPLSGKLVEQMFTKAGFPEGLVTSIAGPGTGQMITGSVDKILFTGGSETGTTIMADAARTLTPVVLELGGKDSMIVLDDADIDRAVDGAVWGAFMNAGQVCAGIKRIYLHTTIQKEFEEKFVSRVKELIQGDGWNDPNVSVGPMINLRELERIDAIVGEICNQGGEILTGGCRNPEFEGYFYEPTIIKGLNPDSELVGQELFGPVVSLFTYETIEEVVEYSENITYALCGSIWGRNIKRAEELASKLSPGTIDVNNAVYTYGLPATPWGGSGKSGFGATHGEAGFLQLMHPHHIHTDKSAKGHDPWWMPYSEETTELQKNLVTAFFGSGKGKLSVISSILRVRKRKP